MEYLILILGLVPAVLVHLMKGNTSMEWSVELITSIVIPVLTVIVSIFVSTRSGNGKVSSAQKDLSKEHSELKADIKADIKTGVHSELKPEIIKTQTFVTNAQSSISGKLDTLDRIINNEILRKFALPPDQSRIDTAVDIIKNGWDSIVRENQELKTQVASLYEENAALKAENAKLYDELDEYHSDEHSHD